MYNIALLSYRPLLQHMNRRKSPAQLMDRQFCLKWVLKQYRKVCWGGAQMPTDRCFNSVRKLGFPPWDQLKGIVGTVEVLAYKAMSFAMDHFALECVCGSIFQCMFGGFFFFFFFFFFCMCAPPQSSLVFERSHSPIIMNIIIIISSSSSSSRSQQSDVSQSQGRVRRMCGLSHVM